MDEEKKKITTDDYLQQSGSTTDNYYDLARQQEYDTLFDTEIQLENARANANKYAMNQLNAQGMGQTGYGQTLQSGIYNNYLNQVNQAKQATQQNIKDINVQEQQAQEAQANDKFQSITTMLMQASTVDQMNGLLMDYGYGSIGEDGNFAWSEKPEGMSDDDWYQMKYYYGLQKDALASSDVKLPEGVGSEMKDDDTTIMANKGGNSNNVDAKKFTDARATLSNAIKSGQITEGTYVAMRGRNNNYVYVYVGANGKVYYTSENVFNGAGNKAYIYNKKYTTDWDTWNAW